MGTPFDSIQRVVFYSTTRQMGYTAEWTPAAGGATQTATVHHKAPSNERKLASIEYNPYIHTMEYMVGDFVGLIESVRSGVPERVTIDGVEYDILEALPIWDGQTIRLQIQPIQL